MGNVLIFVEQRGGEFKKASLEALSAGAALAAELGGDAIAVTAGSGISEAAAGLGAYGAAKVLVADDAALGNYNQGAYADAVKAAVDATGAEAVLFSATAMGKDLSPAAAARAETCVAAECTALSGSGGSVTVTRPVYAGKAFQSLTFNKKPAFVSLRPNVFSVNESNPGGTAPVEALAVDTGSLAAVVKEVLVEASGRPELTEAGCVVAGGRGLKEAGHFSLVEELADALGGAVGATRAVVDDGWRPHKEQVGQTGKTVAPNLYFALGISGAIQHLAGMRSSKVIVAVNKDPEAPIFKVADYGIVGDVFEIVPKLIEEIKKVKA
jgi:electron transfer flavoprotein alpha subunit